MSGMPQGRPARDIACALGCFSIALGVIEVVAPGKLSRMLGMHDSRPLIRAYGVREMIAGVGLLVSRSPALWLWGRVGGDALDLLTLGSGFRDDNRKKENVGLALVTVAAVTAIDFIAATFLSRGSDRHSESARSYATRTGFPKSPEEMRGAAAEREGVAS